MGRVVSTGDLQGEGLPTTAGELRVLREVLSGRRRLERQEGWRVWKLQTVRCICIRGFGQEEPHLVITLETPAGVPQEPQRMGGKQAGGDQNSPGSMIQGSGEGRMKTGLELDPDVGEGFRPPLCSMVHALPGMGTPGEEQALPTGLLVAQSLGDSHQERARRRG